MTQMVHRLRIRKAAACLSPECLSWLAPSMMLLLYAIYGLPVTEAEQVLVEIVALPVVEVRALVDEWALDRGWVLNGTHRDPVTGRWNIVMEDRQAHTQMILSLVPDSTLATRIGMNAMVQGRSPVSDIFADVVAFVRKGGKQSGDDKGAGWGMENNDSLHALAGADTSADQGAGARLEQFSSLVACMIIHQQGEDIQISGLYLPGEGAILTTAHDMASVKFVSITMGNGMELESRTLSIDRERDLALVKVHGISMALPSLSWRAGPLNSDEKVSFLGCPLHKGIVMRSGIVEGPRNMGGQILWQVHMEVEPGSSGSPVFDSGGRLSGLVKGRLRNDHQEGFIIPLDTVRDFLSNKGRGHGRNRFMRYQLPIFR